MDIQFVDELGPGKRLAILRTQKGLTQAELAKILGVSRTTVADYERGRIHLNDETLIKLAFLFKTSVDQLLGLKSSPVFSEDNSLRIMKRLRKINELPLPKQKVLLHTIDSFLKGEGIN